MTGYHKQNNSSPGGDDPGDALRLLTHLFGDAEGRLCIATGKRNKAGKIPRWTNKYFEYPREAPQAVEFALGESERGREAYFCSALLKTDENRTQENVRLIPALYMDGDGANPPADYPSPTAIVETSRGKHHYYWKLREPVPGSRSEREEFALVNKRLTYYASADKGGHDVGQVLRVPGSTNYKPENDRFEVSLVGVNDEEAVDLEEFASLPPVRESRNGHRRESPGEGPRANLDEPPVALRGDDLKKWRGEAPLYREHDPSKVDRSRTLMSIGRALFDVFATRPTIVSALQERDRTLGFEKYLDRPEQYDAIVDELEREGRNETVNMGGPGDSAARGSRNGSQDEPQGSEESEEETQEEESQSYELTDAGNAFRFVHRFGERVRYCYPFKTFLIFDGKRWVIDPGGMAVRMAVQVAREIHHEAASAERREDQKRIARWAVSSQSEAKISAMLKLARSYLRVDPMELDRDPLLFNCASGTIDLRTGECRKYRREDYLTKMSPVEWDPDARAERFEGFLEEIFAGENREELTGFVRRYAGSSLSGLTRDRAFVILFGSGLNGKTTLLELLRFVMGDYAQDTPIESLMQKKYEGVGNDIAALRGARFVTASESEKGTKLAVAKIKKLVGADVVSARFLFQEFFSFKPELKLWIATNHKPIIDETTPAIWDRVHLLPFEERFEGETEDDELIDKLLEEAPGVLAWMVGGFLEWQKDGLGPPKRVQAATDEYRREMDPVGRFLDEQCVRVDGVAVQFSELFERWEKWANLEEEDVGTQTAMGKRLREEGFTKDKSGVTYYLGLRLKKDGE